MQPPENFFLSFYRCCFVCAQDYFRHLLHSYDIDLQMAKTPLSKRTYVKAELLEI